MPCSRQCRVCKATKPLIDFSRDKSHKDGHSYICKECKRIKAGQYRTTTKYHQSMTNWYKQSRYGVDNTWYNEQLIKQNGCCVICGHHITQLSKPLVIDHCHTTGRVRGLLCITCNSGLGLFNDNPEWLCSAAEYLKDV